MSIAPAGTNVRPLHDLGPLGTSVAVEVAQGTSATEFFDNGNRVAVMVPPVLYDELCDAANRLALIEALNEAEASLADGRAVPHEEVLPLLRKWAEEPG
ncbi:MAG: hypothetical protein ACKVT1_20780 [Dehalococcoidia bacterium]